MGQGDLSVKVTLELRSKCKPCEDQGKGCPSSGDGVQRLLGNERAGAGTQEKRGALECGGL